MDEPITRAGLLNLIQTEHARLEAILAQLTEAQMTRANLADEWAVKDTVAHLTFWEQRMLKALQSALQGERPERAAGALEDDLPADESWMDRLNERVFVQNRHRPLPEVLADFRRSYKEVLQTLESLSDEDLAQGSRLEQVLGQPVQPLIAGDTYEHYQEHTESIRLWLDKGGIVSSEPARTP